MPTASEHVVGIESDSAELLVASNVEGRSRALPRRLVLGLFSGIFAAFCVLAVARLGRASSASSDEFARVQLVWLAQGYETQGKSEPDKKVVLTIALKQANLDKLQALGEEVANPDSPKWQKFMTIKEIGELIANPAATKAVSEWFEQGGCQVTSQYDVLKAQCKVAEIENLFDTTIHLLVQNLEKNEKTAPRIFMRTLEKNVLAKVPSSVLKHIEFVLGLSDMPNAAAEQIVHAQQQHASGSYDGLKLDGSASTSDRRLGDAKSGWSPIQSPKTIYNMYKVPAHDLPKLKTSTGVIEMTASGAHGFSESDLAGFLQYSGLPKPFGRLDIEGPYKGTDPGVEQEMDIQWLLGAAPNVSRVLYQSVDTWFYMWAAEFWQAEWVPDIISISYSSPEIMQCVTAEWSCVDMLGVDATTYIARSNIELLKISLRGVSIVVSSGDNGANGWFTTCTNTKFMPFFPASSPWVTTVGGTMMENPQTTPEFKDAGMLCQYEAKKFSCYCIKSADEVVMSSPKASMTSGGGFSQSTPMPKYQQRAVKSYLKDNRDMLSSIRSMFNASGRAYPDIAAAGNNMLFVSKGLAGLAVGTSVAAPTIAGIMAYLVDLSYRKTKKPLGHLSPLLYKMYAEHPNAFTDVTKGSNRCQISGKCPDACNGFEASKGWDPTTGLGTPVAEEMMGYLEGLFENRK